MERKREFEEQAEEGRKGRKEKRRKKESSGCISYIVFWLMQQRVILVLSK